MNLSLRYLFHFSEITYVKFIEGDMHQLSSDIERYLKKIYKNDKIIDIRVDEWCSKLTIFGDHTNAVKKFLLEKGF